VGKTESGELMADKDVTTKLTLQGDSTGMISAMQKAEAQIKSFEGNMANISGTIGKFTGIVGTITAVLAGGAMFKDVVGETIKWTGEAMKLSRMLGITTEEASILNLALGDVYLSMDTMSAASMALNKNTLKNTEVFTHYGIALKDSNGHQRNTLEIMNDVNAKLLTIKEGRDRELAGLQMYGKGWGEARDILKLTANVMEEAKRKAEELHLVVGPEAVANTKAYKAAMNDVEDLWMAMKIQVGNHLLPVLTSLGVWFNDVGPAALFLFEGALKGIMTFVHSVTLGINILWELWTVFWQTFSASSQTLVGVISNVLSGDFKNAAAWAKWGWDEIGKTGEVGFDNIVKKATATNQQLQSLWGLKPPTARRESNRPDQRVDPYDKDGKDKTGVAIAAEDAILKALLAGFKSREQAEKEYVTTSNVEWDYFYRTGVMMESDYQDKKFQLEKTSLTNTIALIDQEIKAVETSLAKKLALETDPAKQTKLKEDAKAESIAKLAERDKLNQDLYRLDVKYQTDSELLKNQTAFDDSAMLRAWSISKSQNLQDELDQTRSFEAMKAALKDDTFQQQLIQIDLEAQALHDSWAMNTDSFETYEKRKQAIAEVTATKRKQLEQQTTIQNLQQYGQYTGTAAALANNLSQLAGKKNKEMFYIAKGVSIANTTVNTAEAVMKAYAQTGIFGGPIAAALVAAVGASQIALIAQQTPDGGGASSSAGGGAFTMPNVNSVTQPVATQQPTQFSVVMNFDGTTLVDQQKLTRWAEDILTPTLRDLKTRGVSA
jgi:hypothetical protein